MEKLKSESKEIETKLSSLENENNEQIMESAESLLELCKNAELAWSEGSEYERLGLIKRFAGTQA